ncbi:MAG: exosortase/archaeosortase family protein [Euryarchaeota archaeon]|jgi:exosortase/archaeosortase family protein|nr:exosortase/archaeosortase family protein [Euryarchaeota archaeon]MBT4981670.1 exosortase/archaeosortase family protein [Euryarchaeota archaeon]MBT5185041.1 exosortase/archaeosortase family protein [Euryarchaeota archaeon]
MAEDSKPLIEEVEDLSWGEFGTLARGYLRIPLALIIVEMFYWFITQPTNTLGVIQESEAWIWYQLTELIYGPGAATLSEYNGWTTLVTLQHPDFYFDHIRLYVSDECAGVHEMIFITVLIMMTTGVPQKLRIRSAIVACGIVYVLNIIRLLILYPLAVSGCNENPNLMYCEQPMHDFHSFVYQWGFLIILVLMWLAWFKWVNAGDLIRKEQAKSQSQWKFIYRKNWENFHKAALVISVLLVLGAFANVLLDADAMAARETVEMCDFYSSITGDCGEARDAWSQEIQSSWSLATLGMLGFVCTIIAIDKPNDEEE